jgi:predicted RNase H-like HicB family nuclease
MRYTVVIEREADGGYVATVPALPGCVSQGDTRDEVARNIREAADLYIEDCIAAGDPVPTEVGLEYFDLTTSSPQ